MNNKALFVDKIELLRYVMTIIKLGAIRFAIAPYLLERKKDKAHNKALIRTQTTLRFVWARDYNVVSR